MSSLAPRNYRATLTPARITDLPFVKGRPNRCLFAIPRNGPTDYAETCAIGEMFAAHYAQYLKDGGGTGFLILIAREMAKSGLLDERRPDGLHGYAVGFFSLIDSLVRHAIQTAEPFSMIEESQS